MALLFLESMRWNASSQNKIRILKVSIIILVALDVLFFYDISTYYLPRPVGNIIDNSSIAESATARKLALVVNTKQRIGEPVRIKIPSIAVDAYVEKVALASDGSMDVPTHPLDTAWYSLGPRPGETGSATIAGHFDWKRGETAVFADLRKLKPGDTITVQDEKGASISFVVRASRKYEAEADATDVFSSNDGKAHLNLTTCSGVWDKKTKQYDQRLVVFADKEM